MAQGNARGILPGKSEKGSMYPAHLMSFFLARQCLSYLHPSALQLWQDHEDLLPGAGIP
jgi:hypothetical protein